MTKRELIDYCLSYPDTYEDYPFDDQWAVLRHQSNKKSFAFIFEREGVVCVNLKCEPMRADFLRSAFPAVTAAYHMNKQHWNTVSLLHDLPKAELLDMIAHSYELTRPKSQHVRRKTR